jgi:hypothetical protein
LTGNQTVQLLIPSERCRAIAIQLLVRITLTLVGSKLS